MNDTERCAAIAVVVIPFVALIGLLESDGTITAPMLTMFVVAAAYLLIRGRRFPAAASHSIRSQEAGA
ncbi:MAG: hypothetical protein ACREU7_11355 [Burkholderiales bacterium]